MLRVQTLDSRTIQLSYIILPPLHFLGSYFYQVLFNFHLSERAQICNTEIYLISVSLSFISAGTSFAFLFLPYCFPSESQALETARQIGGKLLQKHKIPGIWTLLPEMYKPRIKSVTFQWRRSSLRKVFFCAHHNSICVLVTWRNRDNKTQRKLGSKELT